MWISLFTFACGAAMCLSLAAVMMQPAGQSPLRDWQRSGMGVLRSGRPRAARLVDWGL